MLEAKARKAEYDREYRAKNRERLQAEKKADYEANKVERAAAKRADPARVANMKSVLADWRATNVARIKSTEAAYKNENKELLRSKAHAYYYADKPASAARAARYNRTHRAEANARNAARTAKKISATPAWADEATMADFYAEAAYMQMHVDHMIPLQHKLVCGLHVEHNLQLLTPVANMIKSNKYDVESIHAC